jgi:hypothetical protein
MMKFLFVSILLVFCFSGWSQTYEISGRIKDASTKEPLAFVNVIYNAGKHGVVSNIDGYYTLRSFAKPLEITFSLIGYEVKTVSLDTLTTNHLNIELQPKSVSLNEIVVKPGVNPAFRIIDRVIENRNMNNPEKMSSFSYSSYNKMHFTVRKEKNALDSLLEKVAAEQNRKDTAVKEKSYLLLMEFISERKFKAPDKNQEKIVASRVSGFKDPSFTLIATQLQSFSFYDDYFILFDKFYLNPIAPGSTSRYSYLLQDTFLTETMDTLFVISFKPLPGRNFDGLKGIMYVNTNGYAIQNVIAEAFLKNEMFSVKIQQRYELIDRKKWFPTQLNTQIAYRDISGKKENKDITILGFGKSYLRNIKLNPDVSSTRFSNIILSVAPEAYFQKDSLWERYRPVPLSRRDSLTYHILDSIGRVKNFDQRLEIWETLSTGFIPIGYMNVDLRRFFNYNRKEGVRVGLGMQTNNRLSKHFSLGGHFAYGIKDTKTKYGAFLQLFPSWGSDTRFSFNYVNDVTESGALRFVDDQFLFSTELYRGFLVNRMDKIKGFESSFTFRTLKYLKFKFSLSNATRSLDNYFYTDAENVYLDSYKLSEAAAGVKFTFNEKFVQTPRGRKISTGTRYPVLWLNYRRGLNILDGNLQYNKYEARLFKTFKSGTLGKTSITLVSAKADRSLPIGLLYNGHGNYSDISLDAENSFGTMRMNEFYSSEFVSGYFRHNFENLLFGKGKFKPEISLAFNAGVGKMSSPFLHQGIEYKTMEKGFYETGVIFNKILNQKLFGYGFAVYYRLGPYAFARTVDNFSFKLALTFNFQ